MSCGLHEGCGWTREGGCPIQRAVNADLERAPVRHNMTGLEVRPNRQAESGPAVGGARKAGPC